MNFEEKKHSSRRFSIFKHLLDDIQLVEVKHIGKYRYAAFFITPDEVEKNLRKAREEAAEMLEAILEEYDFPIREIKREKARILSGESDVPDVIEEHNLILDYYYPDVKELAAEHVMEKALRMIPIAPHSAQVGEESGYGLPEYSLYWNPDARSFTGRWYWSEHPENDVCWKFIPEEDVCNSIQKIIDDLEKKAEKENKQLLFAIWER